MSPAEPTGSEAGFTLIELTISIVIGALVIGAIAAVFITATINQGGVSGRISDSASAQTTSAYFVRDVESAAFVTTTTATSSQPVCASPPAATFLVGLEWGTITAGGSEVSYWEIPTPGAVAGSSYDIERYYCSGGASAPTSTVAVATGIAPASGGTRGATVAVTPSRLSSGASTDWTSTVGASGISLSGIESASGFHFDLLGTPRLSTPASLGVSPGAPGSTPPLTVLAQGPGVLSCGGNGAVSVNGDVLLDSTSDGAGSVAGNASLTAGAIYTADPNPGASFTGGGIVSPAPVYASAVSDPYASLTPPSSAGLPVWSDGSYHGPGVYTTALSFAGQATTTLATGTYILQQGISLSGQASVSSGTGGVLLYITGGSVSLTGQGSVSLAPLSPPPYPSAPNMGLWQAAGDTNPLSLAGNGSANTYAGTIYAPAATISGTGNAGYQAGSVVVKGFGCSGNGTAKIGY